MKIFEIKNKKIKSGKYGYYKCPKNIKTTFRGYTYEKDGEHLLYTAILQYLSDKYGKEFRKIEVSIYKNGNINVYNYTKNSINNIINNNANISCITGKVYNINNFYLDSENNILYLFENSSDKLTLNRKLKLEKINKK